MICYSLSVLAKQYLQVEASFGIFHRSFLKGGAMGMGAASNDWINIGAEALLDLMAPRSGLLSQGSTFILSLEIKPACREFRISNDTSPNDCWESSWRRLLRSFPVRHGDFIDVYFTGLQWSQINIRNREGAFFLPRFHGKKYLPSSSSKCNHFSNIVINHWILSTFLLWWMKDYI